MVCHSLLKGKVGLRLWVRRKRGNRVLLCSGCGGRASKIAEVREREVRDLPWREYQTTVMVEYYRIRCPNSGLKTEQVPQLPTCWQTRPTTRHICSSVKQRRNAQSDYGEHAQG
jgi:transposase